MKYLTPLKKYLKGWLFVQVPTIHNFFYTKILNNSSIGPSQSFNIRRTSYVSTTETEENRAQKHTLEDKIT